MFWFKAKLVPTFFAGMKKGAVAPDMNFVSIKFQILAIVGSLAWFLSMLAKLSVLLQLETIVPAFGRERYVTFCRLKTSIEQGEVGVDADFPVIVIVGS